MPKSRRRRPTPPPQVTARRWNWTAIANSPLVLTLITALMMGGGVNWYLARQEAIKDKSERRAAISTLLVEYRQRLSALESADGKLDRWLGPGVDLRGIKPISEADRPAFEKAAHLAGKVEQDVIHGTGTYVATSPAYANVNMQSVASQIENTAGVPDLQSGSFQLLGFLNAEPDALWIFVRATLPLMRDFHVRRHMMVVTGRLPLMRGEEVSPDLERRLGIPQPRPGELEALMRKSDRIHKELQRDLKAAEGTR